MVWSWWCVCRDDGGVKDGIKTTRSDSPAATTTTTYITTTITPYSPTPPTEPPPPSPPLCYYHHHIRHYCNHIHHHNHHQHIHHYQLYHQPCIKIRFILSQFIFSQTSKESCPFTFDIVIDYSLVQTVEFVTRSIVVKEKRNQKMSQRSHFLLNSHAGSEKLLPNESDDDEEGEQEVEASVSYSASTTSF